MYHDPPCQTISLQTGEKAVIIVLLGGFRLLFASLIRLTSFQLVLHSTPHGIIVDDTNLHVCARNAPFLLCVLLLLRFAFAKQREFLFSRTYYRRFDSLRSRAGTRRPSNTQKTPEWPKMSRNGDHRAFSRNFYSPLASAMVHSCGSTVNRRPS